MRCTCSLRLATLLLLGGTSLATAASPNLAGIAPRGAQRGTEAVLLFNGARLSDAQEILFYYPGITVSKLEVVNDNQVKATAKIDPACRLGEHAMRVRTASGITELQTFYVGALRVVDEKEPNSDIAEAQQVRHRLGPCLAATAAASLKLPWEEMYACAPQTELMTMLHERAPLRLFAS